MEATTIITPGNVIIFEEYLYLVTISSQKYPGSFNAYRIGYQVEDGQTKWSIIGPRKEFTSAKDVEYSNPVPRPDTVDVVKMLNEALFDSERKVTDLRESVGQWAQKWEDLNDALIAEAEERDWCSEFEDFAEANGLRGCKRDFDVTFTVSYTVSATVNARDEDHARDLVNDWDDSSYLDERVSDAVNYNSPEVEVNNVEEA